MNFSMPSRFAIWNFIGDQKIHCSLDKMKRIPFIIFPDPYSERFFIDHLKTMHGKINVMMAVDITIYWIEKNLLQCSLFFTKEVFLILNSDKLHKNVVDFLSDRSLESSMHKIYFLSYKKLNYGKKLEKSLAFMFFEILAPKFWEGEEYITFMAHRMHVLLDKAALNYLVSALPHEPALFFQKLLLLQISQNDQILTLKEIKVLIGHQKFDRFFMASLFSKKELKKFWNLLLEQEKDLKVLNEFFIFMQLHLFKLLNPSYIQNKSQLTNYDKEILQYTVRWKKKELQDHIRNFVSMEISCKSQNHFLNYQLKKLKFIS